VDRSGKIAFLQSLDLFCLPTVYRESKGISAIEALAAGTPVLLPAHGAFEELVAHTGGGRLYSPVNVEDLAEALKLLLLDLPQAAALGRAGQQTIFTQNTAEQMAWRTAQLYAQVCGPF
jgi:glycosyltransferase involved in cell wall biosynthesis